MIDKAIHAKVYSIQMLPTFARGHKKLFHPFSLWLRLLGGGYLVYLAWDIRGAFSDGPLFILAAVVFALVGGGLFGHAARTLIRHAYFRKPPTQEKEDWEEPSNE